MLRTTGLRLRSPGYVVIRCLSSAFAAKIKLEESWIGYKLHVDRTDGEIPISGVLTSASVHDSQVAIPLAAMTAAVVASLYDLMDSAYDVAAMEQHGRDLGDVPPDVRGAQLHRATTAASGDVTARPPAPPRLPLPRKASPPPACPNGRETDPSPRPTPETGGMARILPMAVYSEENSRIGAAAFCKRLFQIAFASFCFAVIFEGIAARVRSGTAAAKATEGGDLSLVFARYGTEAISRARVSGRPRHGAPNQLRDFLVFNTIIAFISRN